MMMLCNDARIVHDPRQRGRVAPGRRTHRGALRTLGLKAGLDPAGGGAWPSCRSSPRTSTWRPSRRTPTEVSTSS
ncbi:hypothetical protein NKG05_17930 [Oerskovia sp. M15]